MSIEDVDDIMLPKNAVELTASVDSHTESGILTFVFCSSRNEG